MLTIVSHIKEHITTTEFWRALSFVLKRLESIAKYLTQLPLPFTIILYSLHGVRASLRIVHYVKKTKNKNLGETCKFLFSVFKVLIALIAFALLASGFGSLPTALLTAFFSYTVLKLVHSTAVLLASTVFALNMNKSRIEQQWALSNYRCNINKHAALLSTGLLFVSVTYLSTRSRLMWTNPLLLLIDGVMLFGIGATIGYISYKIIKHKRIDGEILIGREHSVQCLKKVLFFGLPSIALLLIILTPGLGFFSVTTALIVLCAQDIVLTIYYYFFNSSIPDPKPAHWSEPSHQDFWKTSWDYYTTFSPIYYLKTQISDQFPSMTEVNQTNKKLLLKMTIIKLLHIESTLEKIEKLGKIGRLILSQKKHQIKKKILTSRVSMGFKYRRSGGFNRFVYSNVNRFSKN